MTRVAYENAVLIDTSAILALIDGTEPGHPHAVDFFRQAEGFSWYAVNVTSHETFTRIRYDIGLAPALEQYDFLRTGSIETIAFEVVDESYARALLAKYDDQSLSYHDALCAAVMLRLGIYKVFAFDADFWMFGFQVVPGFTK